MQDSETDAIEKSSVQSEEDVVRGIVQHVIIERFIARKPHIETFAALRQQMKVVQDQINNAERPFRNRHKML